MKKEKTGLSTRMTEGFKKQSGGMKFAIILAIILGVISVGLTIYFLSTYTSSPILDGFRMDYAGEPAYYITGGVNHEEFDDGVKYFSYETMDAEYLVLPTYYEEEKALDVRVAIIPYTVEVDDIDIHTRTVFMRGRSNEMLAFAYNYDKDVDAVINDYYFKDVSVRDLENEKCSLVLMDELNPVEIWFRFNNGWINYG